MVASGWGEWYSGADSFPLPRRDINSRPQKSTGAFQYSVISHACEPCHTQSETDLNGPVIFPYRWLANNRHAKSMRHLQSESSWIQKQF